jgi:hypothetical protein
VDRGRTVSVVHSPAWPQSLGLRPGFEGLWPQKNPSRALHAGFGSALARLGLGRGLYLVCMGARQGRRVRSRVTASLLLLLSSHRVVVSSRGGEDEEEEGGRGRGRQRRHSSLSLLCCCVVSASSCLITVVGRGEGEGEGEVRVR